jgi:hypothetical protein
MTIGTTGRAAGPWLLCAGGILVFAVCYHWLNRLVLE